MIIEGDKTHQVFIIRVPSMNLHKQLIKKNELTTQELIKVMVIIINKKKKDALNSDYTTETITQ